MIEGVNTPLHKKLIIEGIGYKADIKGDKIVFNLGFSHQISIQIPEGLTLKTDKNAVIVTGVDKEKVSQFAAYIRSLKNLNHIRVRGIMYESERIRRKQGKKTV